MNIIKLKEKLIKLLNKLIKENDIEISEDYILDEKSRLIGASSIFDSMELVQFIVEVENLLEDEYEINIELASEKAMSRRSSPFISINTLSDYIIDESK